jgi:uncharacterized protein (TIGR00730 family)
MEAPAPRLDALAKGVHIPVMAQLNSICVYCGSGPGLNPAFIKAADELGRTMAAEGIRLIYGGGSLGLMGAVATAVLDAGGEVTGIIPDFLKQRELALGRVQELIVTADMHERKRLMFERADAFVALPGGIGTLEELVEQLTWAQLGRHKKPIVIVNIDRFWDPLCTLLNHMRDLAFIRTGLTVSPIVVEKAGEIVPRIRDAMHPLPESDKQMQTADVERM